MVVECIYVWRLVKEKWCDILLETIELLWRSRSIKWKFHIHVYWKWYLAEKFEAYAKKYDFLTYHWFQKKSDVLKQRKKTHYTLMPSRFLETFGLSALDGLSVWTPVIWFQKWWLQQFIEDEYAIREYDDLRKQAKSLKNKIQKLIKDFDAQAYKKERKRMKKIYNNFLRDEWYKQFKQFTPSWSKRILIVSDYNKDIGGIENWLHIMVKKLKTEWYSVEFFWWSQKAPGKSWLFWNLFLTACNIWASRRLKRTIQRFNPDIIWRHSVHRVLWWYPLFETSKKTYWQRIMYHDFWLFHPYPSLVYDEEQLAEAKTFTGFMQEWLKKGWRHAPLLIAKWISFSFIRKQLRKNINLHLVPSWYMLWVVNRKGYIWKSAAIDVLPHFIDPVK